ncbi:MAG: hypothetical protein WCV84_00450 [Patescibacteria group bacterium]
MDRDTWIKYYEASAMPVQMYLATPASKEAEDAAQTKLAYDNDAWDRVMDIVWDLVFVGLTRAEFDERVKKIAANRMPEDVARALLFHVVLPLADLVTWDVEHALTELGVSQQEIQKSFRITLRPVSYGAAVRRVATAAKISLLSEEIVQRAREALISYLKGARTIEQYKEFLQRNQSEAGIGLSRAQADDFVAALDEMMTVTSIVSEEEYAEWLRNYERDLQNRSQKPVPAGTGATDEVTAAGLQTPKAGQTMLENVMDRAMAEINHPELDEYHMKRVRNLISTRLRDVRNFIQVKEVLTRDSKVGGVGFAAEEADRVANIIERYYKENREQVATEEKTKIDQTLAEQEKMIVERRQRDKEERAQWYTEKVQSQQGEQDRQQKAMEALKRMAVAMKSGQPPPQQTASATSPTAMDAVLPPTRLTGLVEEVGGMTIQEFRRLSKTPEQAAQKIRQKFDALRQESFERWTQGVQAWRNSPIQQQYLALMTESFRLGMPVGEVADQKRQADPTVPTQAELGSIISLNGDLQF